MRKLLLLPLLIIVLTGCVMNQRRPFSHIESLPATSNSALLFATLEMDRTWGLMTFNWLELENLETGERQLIRFSKERQVVAVEATPGTYRIVGMVNIPGISGVSTALETEVTQFPLREDMSELRKPFEVKPGGIYYLGDYYSVNRRDSLLVIGPMISASYSQGFSLAGYDCESATKLFLERFPSTNSSDIICVFVADLVKEQAGRAPMALP